MYGYGFGYNFARTSGVDVVVLTPDTIFSTDLYDWWDFTDNTTLTLSGSRIDAIDSKASGSTRQLTSSSSNRPQIVSNQVNGLQVANFDGVSEFMEVPSSTALYNFLHDQSNGGMVIVVSRVTDANPNAPYQILDNGGTATTTVGYLLQYDDRSSIPVNNVIRIRAARNVILTNTFTTISTDNIFETQQFNSLINIVDPNNGIASERSKLTVNFGVEEKTNVSTDAPSNANASFDLTLAKNGIGSSLFFKGDIAEIIITTGQPTALQLTQTQTYLTNKYGTFPIT